MATSQRVVAFGDSNVYGHGLPDCYEEKNNAPGRRASLRAWPSIWANAINHNCLNRSAPGSSNKETLWRILNTKFEPNDYVAIFWTMKARTCIIGNNSLAGNGIDDQIEQFGPWNPKHNRWLARDEWDVILEQLMIIDHANRYLQSKKYIKQIINVSWSHDLPKELPNWCCWKWDLWNINTPGLKSLPKALDGMHVGEEAHKVIAAKMIKVQQQHHQNLTTGSN